MMTDPDCDGQFRDAGRIEDGPFATWGTRCDGCGDWMVVFDVRDRDEARRLGWHQKAADVQVADAATFADAVRVATRKVFAPGR